MNKIGLKSLTLCGGILFNMVSTHAQNRALTNTTESPHSKLRSVDLQDVTWTEGFWADRFEITKNRTVHFMWDLYHDAETTHSVRNFEIAAGKMKGRHRGPSFHDGDFYKVFEAMASLYALTKNPELDQEMDKAIALIEVAQRGDGYLHTPVLIEQKWGTLGEETVKKQLSFEKYNMGHLMTAACVHFRATLGQTPQSSLNQIAKMDVVLNDFVDENFLDATAIQCWTSVQENYGCNVCTSMSMMSENLQPSACEVDVTGTLTMYAMQLASGSPSALVDWNNNYADDAEKVVLFHCGNWAKSFLPDIEIGTAPILGTSVGEENTYGALSGRTPASHLTYGRISTDDPKGMIKAYIGEGSLTNDELQTFGNRAVARIPDLQGLMQYVCKNGFEHHVVMNASHTAGILKEAFDNYLGYEVHHH